MNRKGFTLIELLAVITLLGVIMIIATVSITGVRNKINKAALLDKLELIIPAAEEYAEKIDLYNSEDSINIDGYNVKYNIVSIQDLVDAGYLETGETNVTNPIDDSNINELQIIIYLLRDRTFACIPTGEYFSTSYNANDSLLKGNSSYSINDLNLDSILCKN